MTISTDILLALLAFIFTVVGYLLRQKDAQQSEAIKLLFEKHDEDAKALQELRVQIAEGHYKKVELDAKFDRMESTFKTGFQDLGKKFDNLTELLIAHITKEESK